jgi:hypothetical protein
MQDDDLFAKRPPDNEHRLDQHRQVGEVVNKLPDAGLKLHLPNHANLETEVAQSAAQSVLERMPSSAQRWVMPTAKRASAVLDWP